MCFSCYASKIQVSLHVLFDVTWSSVVSISKEYFKLYAEGNQIIAQVITRNKIQGILTAHVDKIISGSRLSNFSITSLNLGNDASMQLDIPDLIQSFQVDANFSNTKLIQVEFNHSISPSLALDFTQAITYFTDGIVLFELSPSSKKKRASSPQSFSQL